MYVHKIINADGCLLLPFLVAVAVVEAEHVAVEAGPMVVVPAEEDWVFAVAVVVCLVG